MATTLRMQILIRVILVSIILVIPAVSFAERYYTDSDRPGWWNGKDPAKEKEKEDPPEESPKPKQEEKKPEAQTKYPWEAKKELKFNDFTPQQIWDMKPKEVSDLIDAFKDQSIRTLKEQHVHDFYRMMDLGRRKAAAFVNVQQVVMNKYPDVSMEHDASINQTGQDAIKEVRQAEVNQKIADSRDQYGLVYFYRPDCPYCEAEEKVLGFFHDSRHFEIKPVNIREHPDLASRFNITITPSLILVQRGSEAYQPISYGVVSLEELDYRVFSTIRLMQGQIVPEQYGVREYERGGAYDPLAPLKK